MTHREIQPAQPEAPTHDLTIVRMITRAKDIAATAPDITLADFDENDHPINSEFRIIERSVSFDYDGVRIDNINDYVEVTENAGHIAITQRVDISRSKGLERMEALRQKALANDDINLDGYAQTRAVRGIEIAGQPAGVRIELIQHIRQNIARTAFVKFDLHRYLPDGSTLIESGALNAYELTLHTNPVFLYDGRGSVVYNEEQGRRLTDDEARARADALLHDSPRDPMFPIAQPLDEMSVRRMLS